MPFRRIVKDDFPIVFGNTQNLCENMRMRQRFNIGTDKFASKRIATKVFRKKTRQYRNV